MAAGGNGAASGVHGRPDIFAIILVMLSCSCAGPAKAALMTTRLSARVSMFRYCAPGRCAAPPCAMDVPNQMICNHK